MCSRPLVYAPDLKAEFIFVYGTLRKQRAANMHHLMASHCEYFAGGTMQGKLYEVSGYPGAIESGDSSDRVFGELYILLDKKLVLSGLDDYEECSAWYPMPHEYRRKQIPINITGGGSVLSWAYLYCYDVSNLKQIVSGNYLD